MEQSASYAMVVLGSFVPAAAIVYGSEQAWALSVTGFHALGPFVAAVLSIFLIAVVGFAVNPMTWRGDPEPPVTEEPSAHESGCESKVLATLGLGIFSFLLVGPWVAHLADRALKGPCEIDGLEAPPTPGCASTLPPPAASAAIVS